MKSNSTLSKIFAVLSLMAGSIWVGSYLSRLFVVYNLFEGPDLVLQKYITNENINGILFSLLPSILVHFIAFIVMIFATLIFYAANKVNLKFNGWLFIILIAVIITVPFEIYLMTIDYRIITMLNGTSFNSAAVIELLKDRIQNLSSYPIVAILTYISFYYFIVFQPLIKKE